MTKTAFQRFFLLIFISLWLEKGQAQSYDPPAGQAGSRAVDANDPAIKAWATTVVSVQRGLQNQLMPDSGFAAAGSPESALGPALENGVISLGDGGSITLRFQTPVADGPGPDLAVFENGFDDQFLELAFVEVSSDGQHFVRFPAYSETQTQTQLGGFGLLDARNLHNLAGKYRVGFGTPFDLAELPADPALNTQQIHFVRIIDVVGRIFPSAASTDALGRPINDPFPTPYPTGGFDLDAVGAINLNQAGPGLRKNYLQAGEALELTGLPDNTESEIFDLRGNSLGRFTGNRFLPMVPAHGMYLLRSQTLTSTHLFKWLRY